ncbi:MAG: hypothetical protein IT336_00990, partial [Thermomicrobiales bacterium]|nr:hypothetical protein [Thermomicrobiales bacterium]
ADADIAAALFLSVRTVEHHVARIASKLGARGRVAAVEAARAAGLLPGAGVEGATSTQQANQRRSQP